MSMMCDMTNNKAVSAMKSNAVNDQEQGAIQGALYGIRSVGMALGPLLSSGLFNLFTSGRYGIPEIPGLPFYAGGLVCLFALLIGLSVPKVMPKPTPTIPTSSSTSTSSSSLSSIMDDPQHVRVVVANGRNVQENADRRHAAGGHGSREPLLRNVVASND